VTFDATQATLLELEEGKTAAAWYIAQTLLGAEAVGAIDVALAVSVAYAKERHTFGRAIGSYQAVKHELVEMLRGLDNARSLMYYAAGRRRTSRTSSRSPHRRSGSPPGRRSTTPRERRSPCTAASARPGSTTRRCTSAARSSRAGCSAASPARPTAWRASC
jgi:alkylation response protein AidB-like acyl-CoA dehydrogenase